MRSLTWRFCAALALSGCGAAAALAGDAPPAVPPTPAPSAHADAPVELPGLPPLPPVQQTCDAGVPLGGESCAQPRGGLFTDLEYLYVKPYRRGLDYAIVSPNANPDPEGSIQSDPWQVRSAFRVGAGWQAPNGGPEVGVFYTYLHDDQTAFAFRPAGGLLFATQTHPGTVEFADTAAARATLSYDVVDLEVGRRLALGEAVSVRPFGGARFAEIGQGFNVAYNGGDANQDTVTNHLKFDGGGVRAGAQIDWMLLEHLSVYGRAAGSLLVGDFHTTLTEFNNAGATPLANVDESFRKITPVVELALGLAYQREHMRVSVGYEITDWINLIDAPAFVDDVHQGRFVRNVSDLGVDGLAARVEFAY